MDLSSVSHSTKYDIKPTLEVRMEGRAVEMGQEVGEVRMVKPDGEYGERNREGRDAIKCGSYIRAHFKSATASLSLRVSILKVPLRETS